MAVAAPARKAAPAQAPEPKAPARPSPQRRRPLRPTRPSVASRGAAAPAREKAAPAREKAAPARKKAAPARTKAAPARTKAAPSRRKAAPTRRKAAPRSKAAPARRAAPRSRTASLPQRAVAGGQLIPIAVGRTAVAVRGLPDSGLVVRMTRGRAWIAVLGLLLVGIVALNVVTLGFAASAGKIDEEISVLEGEKRVLMGRDARLSGSRNVRAEAAALGLTMPTVDQVHFVEAGPSDVARAAERLAAAGG